MVASSAAVRNSQLPSFRITEISMPSEQSAWTFNSALAMAISSATDLVGLLMAATFPKVTNWRAKGRLSSEFTPLPDRLFRGGYFGSFALSRPDDRRQRSCRHRVCFRHSRRHVRPRGRIGISHPHLA